ncbi:MAG TPA: flagellar hook-basal body protein [Opitutus sp.]|nr:flagellar hook-basal body protein [Opitutus sp.]
MSIGIYQSAATLSALERWQDVVAQNITSSQITGYRKRTIDFSSQTAGELQPAGGTRTGEDNHVPLIFSKANTGINFTTGETEPTRRELDVAIQGDGFFELQMEDGSRVYTRNGEFRLTPDREIVSSSGYPLLSQSGSPITLLPNGAPVSISQDGSIFQGSTSLGKISVQHFTDPSQLSPLGTGYFRATPGAQPEPVDHPELLQGYLEGSNVTPLREMVDMVLISRAYEANQKIIGTFDQEMDKTLQALG